MTITAAADGSALGNPGPAGWAWYIDENNWAAGGWKHATNNKGELKAVLELIRELQSVEVDLGLAQTPLEVAVDDWALAAPADAEDKTRITAIAAIDPHGSSARRRRRPAAAKPGARTGTQSPQGFSTPGHSQTSVQPRRRRSAMIWSLLAAAVVVIGISGTAVTLLLRQSAADIPVVSTVTGSVQGSTVVFKNT